jgi:pilus assembly protein Flp/PilA
VRSFVKADSGATAIEYGLIVAFIAVIVLGAVQLLGTSAGDSWLDSWTTISDAI